MSLTCFDQTVCKSIDKMKMFFKISDPKLEEGIFIELDIRKLIKNVEFRKVIKNHN